MDSNKFFGKSYMILKRVLIFLSRIHVVFGHVIVGSELVSDIENLPTNDKNQPLADIRVENCGELIPKSKAKGN